MEASQTEVTVEAKTPGARVAVWGREAVGAGLGPGGSGEAGQGVSRKGRVRCISVQMVLLFRSYTKHKRGPLTPHMSCSLLFLCSIITSISRASLAKSQVGHRPYSRH